MYFEVNIIMKTSNSPTQGQPNPRKNRLKSSIWVTFFPHSKYCIDIGLGLVLHRKQTTRNLTQVHSPQTPYLIISGLFGWTFTATVGIRVQQYLLGMPIRAYSVAINCPTIPNDRVSSCWVCGQARQPTDLVFICYLARNNNKNPSELQSRQSRKHNDAELRQNTARNC